MVFGIKKRQEGAAERKHKREEKKERAEKLKRIEERAKATEAKRLKKSETKTAKLQAIKRGKEGARGKDKSGIMYKIGKAASKEASRWGLPDEKPKKVTPKSKSRAKPKKKIGVGSISRVRKFNGIKYQLSSSHGTKKLAQKKATYFKNHGESVRIVKTQKGWSVYIK